MKRAYLTKAAATGSKSRREPTARQRKLVAEMVDMIEAAWDRQGLTPLERERRFEAGMKAAREAMERRRGH